MASRSVRVAAAALGTIGSTGPMQAQETPSSAGWRAGIEVGSRPALVAEWEAWRGGWGLGGGAALGPGEGDVSIRATPRLRIARTLGGGLTLGGALGLEWARLDRDGNDEESELQWELAAGWLGPKSTRLEAGARWTDYATMRTTGFVRITLPLAASRAPPPVEARPSTLDLTPPPDIGVPVPAQRAGRLSLDVRPVLRDGSGVTTVASNPRGDPDPRTEGGGSNVDRLGLGATLWGRRGAWRGWARWRSDLHADPSIEERTRAVAEGLSFPVSVSLSAGGGWHAADGRRISAAARLDPQALVWMSHLGEERTARVTAAETELYWHRLEGDAEVRALEPIDGRTVDRLKHARVRVSGPLHGSLRMGVEHERLEATAEPDARWRAILAHRGRVEAEVALGTDLVARVGGGAESGDRRVRGWVSYRSEPEPLHFDALLSRGWSTPMPMPPGAAGGVVRAGLTLAHDRLALEARAFVGEPVWAPDETTRSDGGYVDATWTDSLSFASIEGRARLGTWGPARSWWREAPAVSARLEAWHEVGSGRVRASWTVRSAIRSTRAGLRTSGGSELGVGLDAPLPPLGALAGMMARASLDDVLDRGLPVRPGAPRRGRRLTVVLGWAFERPGNGDR